VTQQTIGIGSTGNDGTGDPIRTAFTKANANFNDLYAGGIKYLDRHFGNNVALAAASGVTVIIPNYGTPYTLSAPLNLASGTAFVGVGRPVIQYGGTQVIAQTAASNWSLSGIVFDGQSAATAGSVNNATFGEVIDCQFQNITSYLTLLGSTASVGIDRCTFSNWGVEIRGVAYCRVSRCTFSGTGFGIWLDQGANRNLIEGNYCSSNGIEMIALTESCYLNRIIGNHAEGCGDNGISVTGYKNTVTGNVCMLNSLSGIYSWGAFNTIVGNECWNNNQNNTVSRAGISVAAAFGGLGQNNIIANNNIGDDQASPTQRFGVKISANSYVNWAQGQVISVGAYRYSGLNLYVSTTAGTTGATAPTVTSGTQSDGGVTWQYKRTATTTTDTRGNSVSNNVVTGWVTGDLSDDGNWALNGLRRLLTTADMA
jgi:parallel beta-helix repeat protein